MHNFWRENMHNFKSVLNTCISIFYVNFNRLKTVLVNMQNCSMFSLAFVAGWLEGHWWGFISRNYVVWPTFFLMNIFIALKGSHFWFYICISIYGLYGQPLLQWSTTESQGLIQKFPCTICTSPFLILYLHKDIWFVWSAFASVIYHWVTGVNSKVSLYNMY